jgi:hypothetical protein
MRPSQRALLTYVAARVVPAIASMALTLLCIDALRPEDYASYSLTLLAAGVAAGFVGGISAQAMLRYARELSASALRRGLLGVPLLASALVCPLVAAYLAWRGQWSAAALIAIAAIPALAVMDTRRSLFVAVARADAVFALDAWRAGLALLLTFVLLNLWGARPESPLLAQALSVLAGLLLVGSRRAAMVPTGSRAIDARYLGYGVGLAGWMAVIVALSLAERSVVAAASGLAASGRYAAQADVINAVFAALGGALAQAMMPAYLAQAADPDQAALRRLRRLALLGVLAIGGLCVLLGGALSVSGLGRISTALTDDRSTAFVLVAAGALWTAAGFVQKPIELRGRTHWLFAGVGLSLLLFLLIAPTLAERHGPIGVAAAKLIAGLAYTGMAWQLCRTRR